MHSAGRHGSAGVCGVCLQVCEGGQCRDPERWGRCSVCKQTCTEEWAGGVRGRVAVGVQCVAGGNQACVAVQCSGAVGAVQCRWSKPKGSKKAVPLKGLFLIRLYMPFPRSVRAFVYIKTHGHYNRRR